VVAVLRFVAPAMNETSLEELLENANLSAASCAVLKHLDEAEKVDGAHDAHAVDAFPAILIGSRALLLHFGDEFERARRPRTMYPKWAQFAYQSADFDLIFHTKTLLGKEWMKLLK
jgi:hypothetical protein